MALSFIVIVLLLSACHVQQQGNQFSTGIEKMREGVTSAPLYLGKEQLIRFDKYMGAHIYLTENGMAEDGLFHITGNIDFVVLRSDKSSIGEDIYVVLRNQFTLTYQEEDGLRKIADYHVQSLPGSADVVIFEQSSHSNVQAQELLPLEQPQTAVLSVNFSDTQWNIPAVYTWQCEMTLDQNQNVILALLPD